MEQEPYIMYLVNSVCRDLGIRELYESYPYKISINYSLSYKVNIYNSQVIIVDLLILNQPRYNLYILTNGNKNKDSQ